MTKPHKAARNQKTRKMSVAYLYPGQGAQAVGMGSDLYEAMPAAKRIFDQAEDVTQLPLKKLCFEGPEDQLARTDIAQPAIFTVSAAVLAVMGAPARGPGGLLTGEQSAALQPSFAAGLSLGEYTALYAAEAMDFATGVKLVAKRGEFMQAAATAVPSSMVSIIGIDEAKATELCHAAADGEILTCSNFNCPGQIVLSGQTGACERAAELARKFGATNAVPLNVAGAFHSEIMAPAAEAFAAVLAEVDFQDPKITVIANVDGAAYSGKDQIKDKLLAQLVCPVRWQQSMEHMLGAGADEFYEIGPGRVLRGLARRIDRKTRVTCVNSAEAVEKLAQKQR